MSTPAMQAEKPHLLVVDDDERLRALLQRYLTTNGFRVSAAADAVGFSGFHVDTYGYPRLAFDASGANLDMRQ